MKKILSDLIAEQSIADAFVDALSEREWNETIRSDLRVYDIEGIWKIRDVVSHIAIFDKAAAELSLGRAGEIRDVTGGRMDEHLRYLPYMDLDRAGLLDLWRETRTQLDNYVTTPQGQAKLNKAVDMLICKGKPASEAREQSYLYFLKKMSSQKEKRLEEEMDKKKQEIMDRITQIENEKIAFEEELKTL